MELLQSPACTAILQDLQCGIAVHCTTVRFSCQFKVTHPNPLLVSIGLTDSHKANYNSLREHSRLHIRSIGLVLCLGWARVRQRDDAYIRQRGAIGPGTKLALFPGQKGQTRFIQRLTRMRVQPRFLDISEILSVTGLSPLSYEGGLCHGFKCKGLRPGWVAALSSRRRRCQLANGK